MKIEYNGCLVHQKLLIKITKSWLKVKDRLLHEDILHTVLSETDSILNIRPLTSISDNIGDLEPLTPNHFLIGQSSPNKNFANIIEKNVNSHTKWKSVEAVPNIYWKRWIKEYLPLLTLQSKWTKHRENMKIRDIVIIEEDTKEQSKWPLARVTKLFYGEDGVMRSVQLKRKNNTLHRPVTKLCVLEEVNNIFLWALVFF